MLNAIIKVTNSSELIITSGDSIVSVISLNSDNPLKSAYTYLGKLEIDVLKIIIMCPFVKEVSPAFKVSRTVKMEKGGYRYSIIPNGDLTKIEKFALELGVNKVEVYDYLLGATPLSAAKDGALCMEGPVGGYVFVTINQEGDLTNAFTMCSFSVPIGKRLVDSYQAPIKNFYTADILDNVGGLFKNFSLLELACQRVIGLPLYLTEKVKPTIEYTLGSDSQIVDDIVLPLEEEKEEVDERFFEAVSPSTLLEEENKEVKKPEADSEESKLEEEDDNSIFESAESNDKGFKKYKGINLALSVLCIASAVVVGTTIGMNNRAPQVINFLNNRGSEIQSQSVPQVQTITYYNNYIKGLNENKNIDSDILDNIYSVKFNGVLSEVHLNQNEVGVQVFLKNKDDIGSVKNEVGKYFNVTGDTNDGQVSLGKTTLYKYTINGTVNA